MLLGQRVTWRNVYRWTHYFYKLEQQSKWEKQALLLPGNTGDTNVTVQVGFEHDAGKKCNWLKTGNFNVWNFKHPIKDNINTLETGKIYSPPMIVERRWIEESIVCTCEELVIVRVRIVLWGNWVVSVLIILPVILFVLLKPVGFDIGII